MLKCTGWCARWSEEGGVVLGQGWSESQTGGRHVHDLARAAESLFWPVTDDKL